MAHPTIPREGALRLWTWVYEGCVAILALTTLWLMTLPEHECSDRRIWSYGGCSQSITLPACSCPTIGAGSSATTPRSHRHPAIGHPQASPASSPGASCPSGTSHSSAPSPGAGFARDPTTNGLSHVLLLAGILVVVGGLGAWIFEPGIGTFQDGLWWSLVTIHYGGLR